MSQSSESDNEGHQGESVEVIRLYDYISILDMIEETQNQQLNVNDQVQDMKEVEESVHPRQMDLSSMSEQEEIDYNESLIVEGSVSSNSLQQEAIETIQVTDQKQKKQIHSKYDVQNTQLVHQQQETLYITNHPQILQEEIGKQKKNRTKNIPRIYGGYLLKQWRGQIGSEWKDIQPQILNTIKDMKPKTLKDINFLRRYQSFREESVSYLESNKLLFDFLESEKIQDIQPLIEVMNQYYLSFKQNKKLINQTQGSQKRVKRD